MSASVPARDGEPGKDGAPPRRHGDLAALVDAMERGEVGVGAHDPDGPVGDPRPAESVDVGDGDAGDGDAGDGDDSAVGERLFTFLLEQRQR